MEKSKHRGCIILDFVQCEAAENQVHMEGKKVLGQKNAAQARQQFCPNPVSYRMSNNVSPDFCWINFFPNIVRSCLYRRRQQELLRRGDVTLPYFPPCSCSATQLRILTRRDLQIPPFSSTNTDVTWSPNSDLAALPLLSHRTLQLVHFTPDVLTPF